MNKQSLCSRKEDPVAIKIQEVFAEQFACFIKENHTVIFQKSVVHGSSFKGVEIAAEIFAKAGTAIYEAFSKEHPTQLDPSDQLQDYKKVQDFLSPLSDEEYQLLEFLLQKKAALSADNHQK